MKKVLLCLIVSILFVGANAYSYASGNEIQMKIVIDIPLRNLTLYENGEIVKTYPVAVGKANSQTPTGEYKVINKIVNPYYSKTKIPGGSPSNPLGSRWIGFKPQYGIHGNSVPKSIGTFASAGCVRMFDRDVQELYKIVPADTPVIVGYDLFKVEYDINGLNPILIVHPDYYFKEPDIINKVNKKLHELNFAYNDNIERLERLKGLINKKPVVFSDKWTYFINGKYITNDIINIDGFKLVNVDKIGKFFNTEILKVYNQKSIRILDMLVPVTQMDNKNYMLLTEIEKTLGGTHTIDNSIEKIDYNLNYILLNNKLLLGEVLDVQDNPKIPLEPIINELKLKIDIKKDSTKIFFNNKEISYIIINDETYVETSKFLEIFDASVEMFTLDNHIEIFSKPEDLSTLDTLDFIYLDNEKYLKISDLLFSIVDIVLIVAIEELYKLSYIV